MTVQIYQGDCIDVLKTLPDQTVQTIVTSPPYYGLRDYGTAKWEGGDTECNHKNGTLQSDKSTLHPGTSQNDKRNFDGMPYKDVCAKCGAIRVDSQIGLEPTPDEYVAKLVAVFRECRRVLRDDGTLWLNLGDSYSSYKDCKSVPDSLRVGGRSEEANSIEKGKSVTRNTKVMRSCGLKDKDLIGIPWRVAFALQADGWYLRSDIIWHKPNPMPESVKDRPTKSHEYIFLLAKSQRYYYDAEAIREPQQQASIERVQRGWNGNGERGYPSGIQNHLKDYMGMSKEDAEQLGGRNKRSVWTVTTKPYREAHFATFPPDLIEPCVLAGCPAGGVVLDPFNGSGTTGAVALKHGRDYIGIELNPEYITMTEKRLAQVQPKIIY